MKKRIQVYLSVFVLILSYLYVYKKGLYDGEWKYKRSIRMYYALKSAYRYGYGDCQAGRPNDWDGESD